jgi:hypothetical protein
MLFFQLSVVSLEKLSKRISLAGVWFHFAFIFPTSVPNPLTLDAASRWINWLQGIFAAISDLYWQFWGNGFHWILLFADPGFSVAS